MRAILLMGLALALAAAKGGSWEGKNKGISIDLNKQRPMHGKRHSKHSNLTDNKFKDIQGNIHVCKFSF